MAFLAAAAAKKQAAAAPAPGAGEEKASPAAAAEAAKKSILGVLGGPKVQIPAADRRIMTDKESMAARYTNGSKDEQASIEWTDPDDLRHMTVTIRPKTGLWKGVAYHFDIEVPEEYPHKQPDVKLREKVWHPNLDLQGNVCLSILRKDWKPVYTLEDVVIGLEFLMKNPDGDDPLNLEAGKEFRENTALFESNVAKSIAGRTVNGHSFSRLSLD